MRAVYVGIWGALLTMAPAHMAFPAVRVPAQVAAPAPALSIGSPNGGRLDGGARLNEAPYLRVVPFYKESNARWGLPALVGLVDRAARRVARRFPDAVLNVGDLSRRGGGELDRHHSHESGRDADVGFYLRSAANKPLLTPAFVSFAPSGIAPSMRSAVFDDARNWALVEALVDDPAGVRVSFIFVAAHIRARLLRYAEQMGVSGALRERAAEVMMQPRRAPHDDHFHVRIGCPHTQRGTCIEEAIVYAPRGRPPVARVRHRSGTESPGLPQLPAKSGAIAESAPPGSEPPIREDDSQKGPTTEPFETVRSIQSPLPLANAKEADSLDH